jgi:hypothetical protein
MPWQCLGQAGLTLSRDPAHHWLMRTGLSSAGALFGLLFGLMLGGPALAQDCGCGPKPIYAKKYGTVKPPQYLALPMPQAPVPAMKPAFNAAAVPAGAQGVAPVNPPATGEGG